VELETRTHQSPAAPLAGRRCLSPVVLLRCASFYPVCEMGTASAADRCQDLREQTARSGLRDVARRQCAQQRGDGEIWLRLSDAVPGNPIPAWGADGLQHVGLTRGSCSGGASPWVSVGEQVFADLSNRSLFLSPTSAAVRAPRPCRCRSASARPRRSRAEQEQPITLELFGVPCRTDAFISELG